jgi:hypothetical protein
VDPRTTRRHGIVSTPTVDVPPIASNTRWAARRPSISKFMSTLVSCGRAPCLRGDLHRAGATGRALKRKCLTGRVLARRSGKDDQQRRRHDQRRDREAGVVPHLSNQGRDHHAGDPADEGDRVPGGRRCHRARHLGRAGSTCAVVAGATDALRCRPTSRPQSGSEPDVVRSRSERSLSGTLRDGGQRDAQRARRGQRLAPARK